MHDDITHIPFRSFFSVYTWNSKDNRIKQFDWFSLDVSWSNVNVDDAIRDYPDHATSGGIFGGSRGEFVGGFTIYLGIKSSIYVELMTVILTILKLTITDVFDFSMTLLWFVMPSKILVLFCRGWKLVGIRLFNTCKDMNF